MLASTAEATTATTLVAAPTKLRALFIAAPFERRCEIWVKTTEAKKASRPQLPHPLKPPALLAQIGSQRSVERGEQLDRRRPSTAYGPILVKRELVSRDLSQSAVRSLSNGCNS